jgi:hypothetical protein
MPQMTCRHLAMSKERQTSEGISMATHTTFDFTGQNSERRLGVGKDTVIVDAPWMAMKKTTTAKKPAPCTKNFASRKADYMVLVLASDQSRSSWNSLYACETPSTLVFDG